MSQPDFTSEEEVSATGLSLRELSVVVQKLVDDRGLKIVQTTNIDHGEEPRIEFSLRPKP